MLCLIVFGARKNCWVDRCPLLTPNPSTAPTPHPHTQAAAFKNVVAKKTNKEPWAKKLGALHHDLSG